MTEYKVPESNIAPSSNMLVVMTNDGLKYVTLEQYEDNIFNEFKNAIETNDKELLFRLIKIHGSM